MLTKKTLIEKLGTEYEEMIKQISIPDFTKCIAQYSGIYIRDLKDEVIEEYLTHWAKNKKYIFDFLGCVKVDLPIEYIEEGIDSKSKIMEIAKRYPAFYPWLKCFNRMTTNKIDNSQISWENLNLLNEAFPNYVYDGTTLTHFFKSKLSAPDDLVTAIGRVWENTKMKGTFTLSIDPVDIMLSSENPYNWKSCYRLETPMCDSHADGCLAGVIDSSTIITYIWDNKGELDLYGNYVLKDVRFKRVRMTIAVNNNFTAVHFNEVYPGKSNYSKEFHKMMRDKIETFIAKKLNKENNWKKLEWGPGQSIKPYRYYSEYGYSEYDADRVYVIKMDDEEYIYPEFNIYDEEITCPCGCGEAYKGSDGYHDEEEYNGEGHINENWYYAGIYCEYTDEREDCDGDCENCSIWRREHPVCELDIDKPCEERNIYDAEDDGDFDSYESNVVHCNPEHCAECPLYKLHHPEEKEEEEEDNKEAYPSLIQEQTEENFKNTVKNIYGSNKCTFLTASPEELIIEMPHKITIPDTAMNTVSARNSVSLNQFKEYLSTAELSKDIGLIRHDDFIDSITYSFDMSKLTKDFIFNKILNHEYFTYEEFMKVVDHVQEDVNCWHNEYILSNGDKTAFISTSIPKDITNNCEFMHHIYTTLGIAEAPDQTNVEARSE